jgi:hypothetical protein
MIKADLLDHGTIHVYVITDVSDGQAASIFRIRSRFLDA